MPLVQCPGCGSAVKVGLDVMGTDLDCPKCGTEFPARTKRSGPRRKQKSQAPFWILGSAVVLMFVIIGASLMGGGKKDPPPARAESAETESTFGGSPSSGGSRGDEDPPPPDRGSIESTLERFMTAVEQGDEEELSKAGVLQFAALHEQRREQGAELEPYDQLDGLQKFEAQSELVKFVLGDEGQQRFLQESKRDSKIAVSTTSDRAKYQLIYANIVDESTTQQIDIELSRVASYWSVSRYEAGEIVNPTIAKANVVANKQEAREKRSQRPLGEMMEVDLLPDTPSNLTTLATKLTDLSLTREMSQARRELIAAGKPAIPVLLNTIYERRDSLHGAQAEQVLSQIVRTLRDITGATYGYVPTGLAGTQDDEARQSNEKALRGWFGWWDRNKDTWTERRAEETIESFDDLDLGDGE